QIHQGKKENPNRLHEIPIQANVFELALQPTGRSTGGYHEHQSENDHNSGEQMKHMQPSHQIVEAPEEGGEGSETVAKIASVFEGLDYEKEHTEKRSGAQVTFGARQILDACGALRERSRQTARKQNERVERSEDPVDMRTVRSPSAMGDPYQNKYPHEPAEDHCFAGQEHPHSKLAELKTGRHFVRRMGDPDFDCRVCHKLSLNPARRRRLPLRPAAPNPVPIPARYTRMARARPSVWCGSFHAEAENQSPIQAWWHATDSQEPSRRGTCSGKSSPGTGSARRL